MSNTNGILYLNSVDAVMVNDKKNNVKFNRVNTLGIRKIGISSYNFNYGIDNINDYTRSGAFETSGQTFVVYLTNGQYTETQLATEVETKLSLLGLGSWIVTYSNNNFVITAPEPVAFIKNPVNGGYRDFFDMMGIVKKNNLLSQHSSENIVNLAYTDSIYILSRALNESRTQIDYNSSNISDHLCIIYLNDKTKISERIDNVRFIDVAPLQSIDQIDILVYDDAGRPLVNNKFNYILEFYTENNI